MSLLIPCPNQPMNPMNSSLRRRQFLTACGAAGLAGLATEKSASALQSSSLKNCPVCVFTKPFNSLSFDQLAKAIAELGFDGIEAPIRKGGHIEPEQAHEKLHELVEALDKHGLKITLMTTNVNDPDDPMTERMLRTAATLGIQRYRMQYVHYDQATPIKQQLQRWRNQFKALAAMNHDFGITGLYQNHAGGKYMGAAIWDLAEVLDGLPKSDLGMAYDIRHATVEGGTSWPISFRMIRDHIDTIYVKDFQWNGSRVTNVPLGQGLVKPQFYKLLADSGFDGPISLHEEYLDHRDPKLVPQHLAAMKQDLATLKSQLK
ncbi:Xylose isomerase-like TIM barrel [Stieleria bergensis]|uniref:Xylose isomerase-like TIM barrel n=2 Tax=Stieleria bergensis TaxID=2528025 RepID=A0A517SQH7_9BACT|nr:Xylose isomerase-like TIM barrel [Planctomycetes bacterium SV_7m_r]